MSVSLSFRHKCFHKSRRHRAPRSQHYLPCRRYASASSSFQTSSSSSSSSSPGSWRTRVAITDADATLDTSVIGESPKVPYAFKKQWYPLVVLDMINPDLPHAVSLFGERLVVWKDGQGEWRVFEDRCPHRAAPLSEGRVEQDGTLMCAYHAWRFDGQGECVSIPQSADPETQKRIVGNPRACATARPSFVAQGLIWAWGEGGPDALMESMQVEASLVPEMEGTGPSGVAPGETDAETGEPVPWNGGAYRNSWQCRDLPYGWAAFFENAIDPAHAVVSHHAVVGDRYDDPAHFECVTQRKMAADTGFRCEVVPAVPPFNQPGDYDDARVWYDFRPPCNLMIDWRHKEGSRLLTAHYAVPTKPGWIRHIVATVAQRGGGDDVLSHRWWKLNLFTLTSPAWMTHVVGPTFLHQDMVLLHQQEKIVLSGGKFRDGVEIAPLNPDEAAEAPLPQMWKDLVYSPYPPDKMDIMFYQWVEKHGPLPYPPSMPFPAIEMDKAKLFDTRSVHTDYCTHCQGAERNMKLGATVSTVLSAACAIVALSIGSSSLYAHMSTVGASSGVSVVDDIAGTVGAIPGIVWSSAYNAVTFGSLAYGLRIFLTLFETYEYSHAEDNIVVEGMASIGLAKDGPSLYINAVDAFLFGPGSGKRISDSMEKEGARWEDSEEGQVAASGVTAYERMKHSGATNAWRLKK
ncbi:Rieske domain-containing protein [Pseudoscourfieldia marina]